MVCPSLGSPPRCLPAVAAREPSDVARCYELGLSADGGLALHDDNDRMEVGGEILENRGASRREKSRWTSENVKLLLPPRRAGGTLNLVRHRPHTADPPWMKMAGSLGPSAQANPIFSLAACRTRIC